MGNSFLHLLGFPVLFAVLLYLFNWWLVSLFTLTTLLVIYRRRAYVIWKTFPRDAKLIYGMGRLVKRTKSYEKANMTVVDAFHKNLKKNPSKPCYVFEDKVWSFQNVEDYSNKIANTFSEAGFKKGDVIALMMTNRAEHVCIWLGLAKLGIVTALINTNLRGKSLSYCISTASCKAVIFSEDLSPAVFELSDDVALYQADGAVSKSGVISLVEELKMSSERKPTVTESLGYADKLLYIFTSGTTGLPKAAILPNSRYIMASMTLFCLCNLSDDDIIYNPLPLYHTAGGALGAGVALTCGITAVLRSKFSASSYIAECIKYKCTVGQYIGEMCRYILSVPPSSLDTAHNLKVMLGNGLRPAIWEMFVERFKIPKIVEVYGATEGNVNIANMDSKLGAVGSLPQFIPERFYPVAIIRMDEMNEQPIRNEEGLCIRCGPDEAGMFVGLIRNNDPSRQFHGYVNEAESKKKIIRDVFTKGDAAFVSGDIMVMDEMGYIYFKDRTGDTYRWKGENVSTSEVESVISSITELRDCTVYGVQIGDLEGKAGMAALVDTNDNFDIEVLKEALDKALPPYARPLFIRIMDSIELTGTFKLRKVELQKEGFNPALIKDKLFFRHEGVYVPLTKALYDGIISGQIKV